MSKGSLIDSRRLRQIKSNARHYAAWRWIDVTERAEKIRRINEALTEDEVRAIMTASDGGFETFIIRYGFY